jgi:hypothetical protein
VTERPSTFVDGLPRGHDRRNQGSTSALDGRTEEEVDRSLPIEVRTVRQYIAAAERMGPVPRAAELTDELVDALLHALQATVERPHGEGWQQ